MSCHSRARHTALVLSLLSLSACAAAPAPEAALAPLPPPPALEPAAPPIAVTSAAPEPTPKPAPEPAPEPALAPPDPALMADIATDPAPELAPAAEHVRKAAWGRARQALTTALGALGADGPLDTRLVGHALLARTCAALKADACLTAEIAAVDKLWASTPASEKRVDAAGADPAGQRRRLARSVAAEGEVLFLSAEQKRLATDAIKRPAYHGKGDREEVQTFVKTKIGPWIAAKRPALQAAEDAYVRVLRVEPAPPPRWVIAAGERVGAMWMTFADEFRGTPMPAAWRGDGPVPDSKGLTYKEVRELYLEQMEGAIAPQIDRARAAYENCSALAARYHVADERSRACDAWLSAHPAQGRMQ
jgi:hypothetical protein